MDIRHSVPAGRAGPLGAPTRRSGVEASHRTGMFCVRVLGDPDRHPGDIFSELLTGMGVGNQSVECRLY